MDDDELEEVYRHFDECVDWKVAVADDLPETRLDVDERTMLYMKKSITEKRKGIGSNRRKADEKRSTRKGKRDSDAMTARTKATLTATEQERVDYVSKRMSEERGPQFTKDMIQFLRDYTERVDASVQL